MGLFRRRPPDVATLLERRVQLVAESEAVDVDAAWTAVSDDLEERTSSNVGTPRSRSAGALPGSSYGSLKAP